MDKPLEHYPNILLGSRPTTLAELYSNKSRWLQKCSAQDALKNSVEPTSPKAVRWCVTGAISLLWDETPRAREVSQILLAYLQVQHEEVDEEDAQDDWTSSIQTWNDSPETTFKDIRRVVTELGI